MATDHLQNYRRTTFRRLLDLHSTISLDRIALALDVTPSAVSHWMGGRGGILAANELALAYLFGVPRTEFYPEGTDPDPRFLGSQKRVVLERFSEHRNRIIRMDFPSRIKAEKEEDWMVTSGMDVPYMKWKDMFEKYPLGNGGFQLAQKLKDAAQPPEKEPVPHTPQVSLVERPKVMVSEAEQLQALLAAAEEVRQRMNLKWKVRKDGSLTAKVTYHARKQKAAPVHIASGG